MGTAKRPKKRYRKKSLTLSLLEVGTPTLARYLQSYDEANITISLAGPTGLLSALLARQLNLRVCMFDAKAGPLEVGGADAITARSQQYLEVASNSMKEDHERPTILQDLLGRGIKCNSKLQITCYCIRA